MWAFCFVGTDPQPLVRYVKGETAYLCEPETLRGRMNMEGIVVSSPHLAAITAGPLSQYSTVILIPSVNREGRPL